MATKKRVKGVLDGEIKKLMRPDTVKELEGFLTPTVQQFLLRLLTHRDIELYDDLEKHLKEFLLGVYLKDNEEQVHVISDAVIDKVSEYLQPWNNRLQGIEDGIKDLKCSLGELKDEIKVIREQVFVTDDKRIKALEKYASWSQTIFRGLVYVAMAVALSLLFIKNNLNDKITRIETMLEDHIKIESVR